MTDLLSPRWIALAAAVLAGLGLLIWITASADADRRARFREVVASLVQYGLLFGFAGIAAAISAHGLIGFARANMGLRGPWPVLLWGALDGAAGLCAVLLMRRAARGESALAPRLAVWGLVAASSAFNWTHAPHHPGARAAFALMPLIAAVLFEFSLRETRHTAGPSGRRLASSRWFHPAERIRVWVRLAADESLTAQTATRMVRVDAAAGRLHRLRQLQLAEGDRGEQGTLEAWRARRAERQAQAALTRARFTDPGVAADVLRQAQILATTVTLANLDYSTAEHAQIALANLITEAGDRDSPQPAGLLRLPAIQAWPASNSRCAWPRDAAVPVTTDWPAWQDGQSHQLRTFLADPGLLQATSNGPLIKAAKEIVGQARQQGVRLSQTALAGQLRAQGFTIANERLRWLAAHSGLDTSEAAR